MFSVKDPKLKIIAGILAVIVLIVGVYMTFFQSRGFVKTTASITDVRRDNIGESSVYYPTVEYTVDGKPIPRSWIQAAGLIGSDRRFPCCMIPIIRLPRTTAAASDST